MALCKNEVSALNVLGVKKLSFIPNHFAKVCIDHKIDTKRLEHWIEYNLNCRYGIKTKYSLDSNKKLIQVLEIGLEDPREMTMLTLGCTLLHKNKKEY
jgi:hypothetical protein